MSVYIDIQKAYAQQKSKEEIHRMYMDASDKGEAAPHEKNRALFHLAAGFADYEAVEILIESGESANVTDDRGNTPLHALAEPEILNSYRPSIHTPDDEAITKTAELLLDAKVSALRKNSYGAVCYHVAAKHANYALIKVLADRGGKLDLCDERGKNCLHIVCTYAKQSQSMMEMAKEQNNLEEIARHGRKCDNYFNIVKLLMEYGLDTEDKDSEGNTPLDYAKIYGLTNIALLLKGEYDESNPEALSLRVATGGKTLLEAAKDGDDKAVAALIKLGADPNEVGTEATYGGMTLYRDLTPLALACSYMHLSCVQTLLEGGADPNFKVGADGRTVMYYMLVYALRNIREQEHKDKLVPEIINTLVRAGLNINDTVDDDSNTALHIACSMLDGSTRYGGKSPKEAIIEELVSLGADPDTANLAGRTPLMSAAMQQGAVSEGIVLTLLENGAKVDVKDAGGNTPLMFAVLNEDERAAKAIINLMTDFGDVLAQAANSEGKTALALATENNKEILVKLLIGM